MSKHIINTSSSKKKKSGLKGVYKVHSGSVEFVFSDLLHLAGHCLGTSSIYDPQATAEHSSPVNGDIRKL